MQQNSHHSQKSFKVRSFFQTRRQNFLRVNLERWIKEKKRDKDGFKIWKAGETLKS